jgi:cell division GTPase FtsZ
MTDPLREVRRALDEARYGAERTLNLRDALPTPDEAAARLDRWMRQQQVDRAGEVLVITGRGKGSAGGVSPVRVAVVKRLSQLQRMGIVAGVRAHTPGSFIVRLAAVRARAVEAERAAPVVVPPPDASALQALEPQTRTLLRQLADCELQALGVRERGPFLAEEMVRQFARLAHELADGPDREARLRAAAEEALELCEG